MTTFEKLTGLDFIGDEEKAKKIEKEEALEKKDYNKLREEISTSLLTRDRRKATELLVKKIEAENYIYTTRDDIKSEMWIYDDGVYVPQGKSFVREFCRIILKESFTTHLCSEVISKIEADTFIEQEKFFENKYVEEIPVQNGILNVKTLKVSAFDPEKIFFNKLPVTYDPECDCPNIEQFLKDILAKEEDIIVVYELIGSGLLKEYFTEKAGMFVGNGRNGKSKLLELIKRLVGIENCCSVPLRAMKEDNSSLCELHERLFNLAGDISHGELKDTGCFKQTVGRDTLQAHRKFLRDLIFVNHAKHIFACNELPRVYDTTEGFWSKWILLEFPYKFVSEKEYQKIPKEERGKIKLRDQNIVEKISTPKELSGLLNKALDGLKRLLNNKDFSQTKGSKEIKDFWIRNSDSFAAFCIDCVDESYDSFIIKKTMRKRYYKYCREHKVRGCSDKVIKITLEERYGVSEGRKSIKEEIQHVWEGIKFKSDL